MLEVSEMMRRDKIRLRIRDGERRLKSQLGEAATTKKDFFFFLALPPFELDKQGTRPNSGGDHRQGLIPATGLVSQ